MYTKNKIEDLVYKSWTQFFLSDLNLLYILIIKISSDSIQEVITQFFSKIWTFKLHWVSNLVYETLIQIASFMYSTRYQYQKIVLVSSVEDTQLTKWTKVPFHHVLCVQHPLILVSEFQTFLFHATMLTKST